MDRRLFLAALASTAAGASAAGAQTPARLPEIGLLYPGSQAAVVPRVAAFLEGLKAKGYVDGRNIALVVRVADAKPDQFGPIARELVGRGVRVLFAVGPAMIREAHAATKTIPIVAMDLETDPVKDGLVASIARPGGNVTGLFFDFPEFAAKWVELLLEVVPGLSRLAVLWDPATGSLQLDEVTAQARARGLALQVLKATSPADLEPAFAAATTAQAQGLLVLSSPLFGANPKPVADLALKHRLPSATLFPEFAQLGGLLAYGTSLIDLFTQGGGAVAKVLDGAKPQDLPIERPTRFQLVINLKTARALGLTIPPVLLLRADEVIE